MHKYSFVFVAFVISMLILLPLHNSFGIYDMEVKEDDHVPKIGFYTVGDPVTITLNVTNHSTDTRILQITEEFGPPNNLTGPYPAQKFSNYIYPMNGNSTMTIPNTFQAVEPGSFVLGVWVNAWENYTLRGNNHSNYSKEIYTYIHPSSDRDIRVLAESMRNSSVIAQNNLNESKQQGNWLLVSAEATAALAIGTFVLAGLGIRQDRLVNRNIRNQERVSRLAYGPLIWPRFEQSNLDGRWQTTLYFENIGNGAALNVDIAMTLVNGQPFRFTRFAFSPHLAGGLDMNVGRGSFGVEKQNTGVDLDVNRRIPATIRYQDITMQRHEIRGVIIFENNEVRLEVEQMNRENNNENSRRNQNEDDRAFQRNLTLDSIHFGGLIALGATVFSVGAALWLTSASMLGPALDAGATNSYSFKIMNALQQITPVFLVSGFLLIIAGFVIPMIRLRR